MNILLIILTVFVKLVNSNWPLIYEANIQLQNVVCPSLSQMYVMAQKFETPNEIYPYSNIYASPYYGYYELFICQANPNHISTGCQYEIIHELNFRYAHIATQQFTFFVNNFVQRESHLVHGRYFDLCIIDATNVMRNIYMGYPQYPSIYDRLQMPRKCWRISLEQMPLDPITQAKMNEATTMKLTNFRKRRNMHYTNLVRPYTIDAYDFDNKIRAEIDYGNKLIDEFNVIRLQTSLEDYSKQVEAKNNEIAKLEEEIERKKIELAQKDQQIELIKKTHEMKIEEEARLEKEKIEKNLSPPAKRRIDEIKERRADPNITLNVQVTNKRQKRNTGDEIIEQLKTIKPKKQQFLLDLATNEILPSGSMDVDGLIEEVMTIRKENSTPEEAKQITFDTILSASHEEWQKIAANDEIKLRINMIAVRNMQKILENTLLIDPDGDDDLETMASDQITNLENSIKETHENEKTMKEAGTYTEYRRKLLHEVKEIMEKTEKMEKEAVEKSANLAENVQAHVKSHGISDAKHVEKEKLKELHHPLPHTETGIKKSGTSEIEEVEEVGEEVPKREKERSGSETDEEGHHHKDVHHNENHGMLRTVLEKSRELLDWVKGNNAREHVHGVTKLVAKSAEHLKTLGKIGSEKIAKYGLDKRAKSAGVVVLEKANKIGTTGKSILNGAKNQAIDGLGNLAIRADLWKASSLSEAYKAEHPDKHIEILRQNMENLKKEHPEIYKKHFGTE